MSNYRLCMVVFVLVLSLACSRQNMTKEQLVAEGSRLLAENKAGKAITAFKNALEKDENFSDARLNLAKAYNITGNYAAAEKELEKVRRQNPNSHEVKIEIARVLSNTKRPDDALRELAPYLGPDSTDCDALQLAGLAHSVKEENQVAISLLKRAVTACGDHGSSAALMLASVYLDEGESREAETLINGVLKKEPQNRSALFIIAQLQAQRKDRAAALKTYDRILEVNPNDLEAQYRKGLLYLDNQDIESALKIGRGLMEKAPNRVGGYRLAGFALYFKKEYGEALALLQKSLSLEPNAGTYHMLGLTYLQRNEMEQAVNQFQKALDLQPALTVARVQLAQIYLAKKRPDEAMQEAKKALAEESNNALAHNVLGSVYLAKGQYAEGIAELNRALALDASLAQIHVKKALVAMKRGYSQEAETELAAAVRVKPEEQGTRRMLALYYIDHNQAGQAIALLQKGLHGDQSDAVSYYLMAEASLRNNKDDDAVMYLTKAKEADPKYGMAYLKIASIYIRQQQQDKGVQELRNLLQQSPDNIEAMLTLGTIAEINGDDNEARKKFMQAAKTEKNEGVIAAAQYLWRTGDTSAAIKILNEATGRPTGRQNADLYEIKGTIQISEKKYRDALSTYEAADRFNPKLGFTGAVKTYVAMGDYAKAADKVQSESRKNPTSLALRSELSRIQLLGGNKQAAADTARMIIADTPGAATGYLALARVYQSSKDMNRAVEVLKSGSKVRDANIPFALASLYVSDKKYGPALEQVRRAETMAPGAEQVLFLKGAVLDAMGKKKEAEVEYQKVLKRSPYNPLALNNLAYLYLQENRNQQLGLAYASRAFLLAPRNDSIRDTLGYALVRNGKVEQGLKMLQRASISDPDNPTICYHLALAYKEQGNLSQATASLQKALSLGDFSDAGAARALLEKINKGGNT